VLAVIEHAHRRIRILGATAHATTAWVNQAARNLVMDLDDVGYRARFMIRDRDDKFPARFDAVLADASIQVVLSGIQMPSPPHGPRNHCIKTRSDTAGLPRRPAVLRKLVATANARGTRSGATIHQLVEHARALLTASGAYPSGS
jgi:hypothetical protein